LHDVGWFGRRRELRHETPSDIGDIEVGQVVRLAWGSTLGWVMWMREASGTCGVHWNHTTPGTIAIEKIKFLRPAAQNPASGLDVRGE
jgi:hypothetical protein